MTESPSSGGVGEASMKLWKRKNILLPSVRLLSWKVLYICRLQALMEGLVMTLNMEPLKPTATVASGVTYGATDSIEPKPSK